MNKAKAELAQTDFISTLTAVPEATVGAAPLHEIFFFTSIIPESRV